ncbi:MAG TPA: endonuclease/exonuclease/phosphatase family protein [Gemmatimonadales bacterium]|nr:endonuclease/exonuclease/phosphatase family protein [Gemmatimonadales bacterium]
MHRTVAALIAAFGFIACIDRDPAAPDVVSDPDLRQVLPSGGAGGLVVMTRNVYVGSNIDSIPRAESLEDLLLRVTHQFGVIQSTNFAERAEAIADEIAATRPHLIGLQEISKILRQYPGDILSGGTTPATDVVYDYLALLMNALDAHHLDYRVAALTRNWDVELPSALGEDLRLIDYEAVLARGDVAIDDVQQRHFSVNLTLPVLGSPVTLTRGWAAVRATVDGRSYRFVSTHLEPADIPELWPIQMAQAAELIGAYGAEQLPLIFVGDFNTNADGTSSPTYGMLMDADFVDAWSQAHPGAPAYSCCQASDLRNTVSELVKRVDLILVRDRANPAGRFVGGVQMDIVGESAADRTPSGLWPSDHAGFVARLRLARGP